jgi:hypothetical protein
MTMFLADKGAPGDPSRATPIGNTLPHRTEPFPITLVAPPDSGPFQIEVRSNGRSVASVRAAKPGTFPLTISVGALPVVITARDASGQEASQEVQDFSQPLKLTLP